MHVTVALGGGGEWEKSKVSKFLLSYVGALLSGSPQQPGRRYQDDLGGYRRVSADFVSQSTKEEAGRREGYRFLEGVQPLLTILY